MEVGTLYQLKYTASEEAYKHFIALSNDHNPLHVADAFAQQKGFPSKVMHGNILNAFLSHFIGEGLPTKDVIIHSQEIQFKNPVFLNDELDFNAELAEYYESVKACVFKFSFKNKAQKVVAKGKIQIGII